MSLKDNYRNKLKEKYAIEWCLKNNYRYEFVTEKFFKSNEVLVKSLTNNVKILKQLERICI